MRVRSEIDRLSMARPPILERSAEVVDAAAEDRLLHQILTNAGAPAPGRPGLAGPARHRWAGLLAGGLGLTAAAAAVAVVVAGVGLPGAGPLTVPAGTAARQRPAGRSAVQQILLTAASAAARAPATTGIYWYVRTTFTGLSDTFTTWTVRDGTTWTRAVKTHGAIVKVPRVDAGWNLEGSPGLPGTAVSFRAAPPQQGTHQPVRQGPPWPGQVTFRQLQGLPTSPAALKAWVVAFNQRFLARMGSPLPAHSDAGVVQCLINLVVELPEPPHVRAAAFRALATLPGVSMVGSHGVRFSLGAKQYTTLVVNPATTRAVVSSTGPDGSGRASVKAHWVNRLP